MSKLRILACLIVLWWAQPIFALPADSLPQIGSTPEAFLPKGWSVQAMTRGDLNGDGKKDVAFIGQGGDPSLLVDSGHFIVGTVIFDEKLQKPRTVLDTNPRLLIVLLGTDTGYRLLTSNPNLLPTPSYPNGDALDGLDIVDGTLSLGLMYADRRHGELYSKVRFHFQLLNDGLVLTKGTRLQLRRYATDLEETRDYDFLQLQVKSTKFRYSTRELLSEDTSALESGLALELSKVTPETPMPSWEPQP